MSSRARRRGKSKKPKVEIATPTAHKLAPAPDTSARATGKTSTNPPKEGPLTTRTFVIEALLYVVLGAFTVGLFDQFGLEIVQRLALQDGFNQVVADSYGVLPARRGQCTPPPAEVAVVLWREADLKGKGWPLPYIEHARALRDIGAAGPRAVFIDVLFKDRRRDGGKSHKESLRPLVDVIRDLAATGIPLYLLNEGGCSDDGVLEWLLPVRKSTPEYVIPTTVSTKRIGDDADADQDGVDRRYVMFANRESSKDASLLKECTTAPLRMHLGERARERPSHGCRGPFDELASTGLAAYDAPLSIFWGGCPQEPVPMLVAFARWLIGFGARRQLECGPFPILNRTQLVNSGNELLRDKLVVYGTDFDVAGDRAATAIHERPVAGPIVNAMALDNLQRWGTRYLYHPASRTGEVVQLSAPDFIMLSMGALLFPVVRRRPEKKTIVDRMFDRFASGRAMPLRGKLVAATRTLRSILLVPLIVLVAVAPLVFAFGRLPIGAVAPHAFAWVFVAAAFELRKTFESHLPSATKPGGAT